MVHHRGQQRIRPPPDRAASGARRPRCRNRPRRGKGRRPHRALSRNLPRRATRHDRYGGNPRSHRTLLCRARTHRRHHQQCRLWPVRRGGGTCRRAGRTHRGGQPARADPAHPCRAAPPSRPARRTHHPDLVLRRSGRVSGELAVPRHQVGHRRLRGVGRPGGRILRDRHDDRRARRRAHRVPLRRCAGGEAHARLRRHPGTRLPADARSSERTCPR
jgi:hypothetical protein